MLRADQTHGKDQSRFRPRQLPTAAAASVATQVPGATQLRVTRPHTSRGPKPLGTVMQGCLPFWVMSSAPCGVPDGPPSLGSDREGVSSASFTSLNSLQKGSQGEGWVEETVRATLSSLQLAVPHGEPHLLSCSRML